MKWGQTCPDHTPSPRLPLHTGASASARRAGAAALHGQDLMRHPGPGLPGLHHGTRAVPPRLPTPCPREEGGAAQGTSPTEGSSLWHSSIRGKNRALGKDRSSTGSKSHKGWVTREPAATARPPPRSCTQGSYLSHRGRVAALGLLRKALACGDREEAGLGEAWVLAAPRPQPRNRSLGGQQGPHIPDRDLALGGRAESSSVAEGERKDTQSLHRPGTATGQPHSSSHPSSWGSTESRKTTSGQSWEARAGCRGAARGEHGGDSGDQKS